MLLLPIGKARLADRKAFWTSSCCSCAYLETPNRTVVARKFCTYLLLESGPPCYLIERGSPNQR